MSSETPRKRSNASIAAIEDLLEKPPVWRGVFDPKATSNVEFF
jgi:hypothetical protein